MKIYTKTGDKGYTSLVGGKRVPKDSLRMRAIGGIDELNAHLGLCRGKIKDRKISNILHDLQKDLFVLGTDLSTPMGEKCPVKRIGDAKVKELEGLIDELDEQIDPLENFILPGGIEAAAYLHFARTVCRKAERVVNSLKKKEAIGNHIPPYLNRLSDFLFVMARYKNKKAGIIEEKWQAEGK